MNNDQNNKEKSDTGVKFHDEWRPPRYKPETPKVIQWVIKYSGGFIKNDRQAQYAVLGFVALAIVVTVVIVMSGESPQPTSGQVPIDQFVP